MKKEYKKPNIEIVEIDSRDVITTSQTENFGVDSTKDYIFSIDDILKF